MAAMMFAAFLWAKKIDNYGFVDVCWSLGLAISAVGYALYAPGLWQRRLLVSLLAGAWATRLTLYLYFNRVRNKPEDGRYQKLREKWGESAPWKFFLFFQVQASWDVLFAIPFVAAMYSAAPLSVFDALGVLIWLLAVSGESLADYQLARFRADVSTKGQTCNRGLWRYSRHPNYFFEWLHWFAYIAFAQASPYWYLAALGPVVMWIFLFKITGIPHTEKQALRSRGESYRRYQETTSMFIPWFPKEVKNEEVAQAC